MLKTENPSSSPSSFFSHISLQHCEGRGIWRSVTLESFILNPALSKDEMLAALYELEENVRLDQDSKLGPEFLSKITAVYFKFVLLNEAQKFFNKYESEELADFKRLLTMLYRECVCDEPEDAKFQEGNCIKMMPMVKVGGT